MNIRAENLGIVLVTGATGFIGTSLCRDLLGHGFRVRAAVRCRNIDLPAIVEQLEVGNISHKTDWTAALRGVTTIAHLASGAASQSEGTSSLLDRYREVNVGGAQSLAKAAAKQGVQRLLFMSTIKVNGECTAPGKPFTEDDSPQPQEEYAQSKWEAEQLLHELCGEHGPALTVLRPPIVYGPRCKGNFITLMRAVDRGWPLPFAAIRNLRSLIYIGNLTSAVIACLQEPRSAGKTYLVSDGSDISTPDWIRAIGHAAGRRARLLSFPPLLLNFGASLLGKADVARRLTQSLQVDSTRFCQDLGWRPPFTLAEGFAQTARWYHAQIPA